MCEYRCILGEKLQDDWKPSDIFSVAAKYLQFVETRKLLPEKYK